MSEAILGVIIGGTFGFLGALLGIVVNIWAERRKEKRQNLQVVRLRLVGDRVQTSEIMRFIELQRERKWPFFWRKGIADLSRAQLEGVDFRNRDLRNITFYRANLQDANFLKANLQGCDFSEANLSNVSFYKANARITLFYRANLCKAELFGVDMANVTLVAADLSEAKIRARLTNADMRSANLESAVVRESNLAGTNLAGVRLSGAQLEDNNLEGTVYNRETIWPEGFDPEKAGAEFIEQCGSKTAMVKMGMEWRWGRRGAVVGGRAS